MGVVIQDIWKHWKKLPYALKLFKNSLPSLMPSSDLELLLSSTSGVLYVNGGIWNPAYLADFRLGKSSDLRPFLFLANLYTEIY